MSLISHIQLPLLDALEIELDLLRLDQIHPQISGNKWFKLKYNIESAISDQKSAIVTFGGAYSNHLHALAFAGKEAGMPTIGYVRGENIFNATLQDCKNWGMQLHFMSRADYRHKSDTDFIETLQQQHPDAIIIPEGGSNELGLKGCHEILSLGDYTSYHYIACAIGTGTTFVGIAQSLDLHQHAIGFTAMKGGEYLIPHIEKQLDHTRWTIETEFAYGGFGKKDKRVLELIADFNHNQGIELDFVYTGKMLCGLLEKIRLNPMPKGTKILTIHTGGVQGNRSL